MTRLLVSTEWIFTAACKTTPVKGKRTKRQSKILTNLLTGRDQVPASPAEDVATSPLAAPTKSAMMIPSSGSSRDSRVLCDKYRALSYDTIPLARQFYTLFLLNKRDFNARFLEQILARQLLGLTSLTSNDNKMKYGPTQNGGSG